MGQATGHYPLQLSTEIYKMTENKKNQVVQRARPQPAQNAVMGPKENGLVVKWVTKQTRLSFDCIKNTPKWINSTNLV